MNSSPLNIKKNNVNRCLTGGKFVLTSAMLQPLNEKIYYAEKKHSTLGIPLGMRMAVILLEDESVMVYSPLPWTENLHTAVSTLGKVSLIFAPNQFHNLGIESWKQNNPEAKVLCSPELNQKLKGIADVEVTQEGGSLEQASEFFLEKIQGMPSVNELVLMHKPSNTLLVADLLFYFPDAGGLMSLYARANKVREFPSPPILWKLAVKDKALYKRSINRIRGWEIDSLFLCHGKCIRKNAEYEVSQGLATVFND